MFFTALVGFLRCFLLKHGIELLVGGYTLGRQYGWVQMSFLVAIIGRYGVGKSLLCRHFEENGLSVVDIRQQLLAEVSLSQHAHVWQKCVHKDYHELSTIIPMLTDLHSLSLLKDMVAAQRCDDKDQVVVLPSFVSCELLIQSKIIDFVVAVDCSIEAQREYLSVSGMSQQGIELLQNSGYERLYYRQLATDVFLNTVELAHVEWVTKQLLCSYRLLSQYC